MQKFAVIGYPISHSISPRLHNLAINSFGFDAFYGRILLEDGTKLRETFKNYGLNGANITIPHKENAFTICRICKKLRLIKHNCKIWHKISRI